MYEFNTCLSCFRNLCTENMQKKRQKKKECTCNIDDRYLNALMWCLVFLVRDLFSAHIWKTLGDHLYITPGGQEIGRSSGCQDGGDTRC